MLPDYTDYTGRRGMTLAEIKASDKDVLTATDISAVLGMHPSRICYYAKNKQLPFPAIMSGNRAKIPRVPFLKFMGEA